MCTGLEIAALAATAAGTATEGYAQHQQLSKQNDIAAAGIIKQGQMQKQGENEVSKLTGTVAQSNAKTQDATNKQLDAYRSALQQGAGISSSASPNVPGASKAYKAEQGVSGANASDYVQGLAKSAAVTNGTQLERVGENQQIGDTASNLGLLNQKSQEQNYLTKLQVQSTQANPWLMGLGTLLQGAGMGMGMGAGVAAAKGASIGAASTIGAGTAAADSSVGAGAGAFGGYAGTAGRMFA